MLDEFVAAIAEVMKTEESVRVKTRGSFGGAKRSARTGRGSQSGTEIRTASKNAVDFEAGAELSQAVNQRRGAVGTHALLSVLPVLPGVRDRREPRLDAET